MSCQDTPVVIAHAHAANHAELSVLPTHHRYPTKSAKDADAAAKAARSLSNLFTAAAPPSTTRSNSLSWAADIFESASSSPDSAGDPSSLGWAAGCWLAAAGPSSDPSSPPPRASSSRLCASELGKENAARVLSALSPLSPPSHLSPERRLGSFTSSPFFDGVSRCCFDDGEDEVIDVDEDDEEGGATTPMRATPEGLALLRFATSRPPTPLKKTKGAAAAKKNKFPLAAKSKKRAAPKPKASSTSINKKAERGVFKKAPPPKASPGGGGFTQPRGRPPHDANGVKMLWDRKMGHWLNGVTGAYEYTPK